MSLIQIHSLLVVISAPSGGGKTTVCENLMKRRPGLTRAVTCTTREPREGETDGVDYFFMDAGSFLKRVQAGNFLEHATVFGNSYGILKSEVLGKLRQNMDVLLAVDVQGAATIRQKAEDDTNLQRTLVTIFLAPPSIKELESRLRGRDQDNEATIRKRLAAARQEIAQSRHFDYVVVSASREKDLQRILNIIETEKLRQPRVALPAYDE
jgi:guanylate kinase